MRNKVVLIGLDGATFSILEPLLSHGHMPTLKSLVDSGVRANLRSIVPALTPPAWTSMMTGRTPGQHGIYDFFQLDAPDSKRIRLTTAKDKRCDSVWDIVTQYGLRATVLNFPVTFPPPKIRGQVISGWMPWRQLRLGCHPPDLYDRLKLLPDFNPRELAMDMELEAKATEGCRENEYLDWIDLHRQRDKQWLGILRYLMREEPSELTAVVLDGPDKIQHLCWPFLDPTLWPAEPTPQAQQIRDRCIAYYGHLDKVLAEIIDLAGRESTIIIASDHGFGSSKEVFHVNAWLAQTGYLTWSDQAHIDQARKPGILGMGHLTRHTQWLDWGQTTAYAATPTSNGIHIVKAGVEGEAGVLAEDYEQFRRGLIDSLYRLINPRTNEPFISRIWTREEAFAGQAMALAPDLTLVLRDGGLVSILPADHPIKPRPQPTGVHDPSGIFVINGPGVRRGLRRSELSILTVASTLLYSLGLPIPEDMAGQVPLDIFEPSFHPVSVASHGTQEQDHGLEAEAEILYDEEAEAIMMARLRALGYIE